MASLCSVSMIVSACIALCKHYCGDDVESCLSVCLSVDRLIDPSVLLTN